MGCCIPCFTLDSRGLVSKNGTVPIIPGRWDSSKSKEYVAKFMGEGVPLIGVNYVPAYAVNVLEMWQSETFSLSKIENELDFAKKLGVNLLRVFLHSKLLAQDKSGFLDKLDSFLGACEKRNIFVMFVFFEDVWGFSSKLGKQPEPIKGKHNSRWVQCPGLRYVEKEMESYVKDIITKYKDDKRIFAWDLYNEPGNSFKGARTFELLEKAFKWAREVNPSQPLTAGSFIYPGDWRFPLGFKYLNMLCYLNSDIVSFHTYDTIPIVDSILKYINGIQSDYPMICSEYMARKNGSLFSTHLPFFLKNKIIPINWGLCTGRCNCRFPWDSLAAPYKHEPDPWFHDILHENGTPYIKEEVDLICECSKKGCDFEALFQKGMKEVEKVQFNKVSKILEHPDEELKAKEL